MHHHTSERCDVRLKPRFHRLDLMRRRRRDDDLLDQDRPRRKLYCDFADTDLRVELVKH